MQPFILLVCSLKIVTGILIPTVELSDGNKIPVYRFWYFCEESKFESAIAAALAAGYRYIDTAFVYYNHELIGKALKKWFVTGGKREELFITTKLPSHAMRPSDIEEALNRSLNVLGVDYVDMYLIHKPTGFQRTSDFKYLRYENGSIVLDPSTDLIAIWKELENQTKAGKTKSIGISNFNKTQILKLWEHAEIKPTNLQVESNVYLQQEELLELCRKLGIVMTGYSPLGSGTRSARKKREIDLVSPIQHPLVVKIAENHSKSPAQILLRFNVQRNIIVIPKSANPNRIKENADIFDFELTKQEMNELRKLDQHGKYRKFVFKGIENHPEYPFADILEREQLKDKQTLN